MLYQCRNVRNGWVGRLQTNGEGRQWTANKMQRSGDWVGDFALFDNTFAKEHPS